MSDVALFAAVCGITGIVLGCVVAAWALRKLERWGGPRHRQSVYDWYRWME